MAAASGVSHFPICTDLAPARDSLALSRLRLLRLSVTDRCNFRCRYCMPADGAPNVAHHDLLPLERLVEMVQWLTTRTGIKRVRLTGGEPLARRGMEYLVAALAALPAIREVSLTTNGSLLSRTAAELKAAGLSRVNISLDSLDESRFAVLSRGGSLERTLDGINSAELAGLTPIRLNTVLQRSTWQLEVPRLLDYAASRGFEIRFIELMRTGTEREWCESEFVSVDEVSAGLNSEILSTAGPANSSARRTILNWRGTRINVGWISPRSHPFCARCERLRMDARGRIRRCLMDPAMLDLHHLLQSSDDSAAWREFQTYLANKMPPSAMDSAFAMSQIGG
jgi:cyclic pyranopterin phosphate synthase